ncbi:MAG: transposase [Rhodobacteraceae bacterium]|nr:transposase [Paracoccaceae bacterium]
MPLNVREYVCNECGLVLDRDVNAARNILRRGMSLAGWEIGLMSHPGVSEDVGTSDVAGLPGQDTERYAAENGQSGI